jgi:PAS domain S-box-containing protein
MGETAVLVISALLQFVAAFLALRLIRVTGRRRTWLLIAIAVSLMATRRCLVLFRLASEGPFLSPDLIDESVALATSAFMVAGLAWIAPLFLSIKRSEEALRLERDFAESLIETAPVIVLVLDPQGRIVRFNPCMEEISAYRLQEVQGKDWFATFLPERERDRTRTLFLQAIDDIQTRGNVNAIVTKDGREREIEWYDKTLKDADGNAIGLLSIGQDITERRRTEEELKRGMKQLTALNQASQAVTASLELDRVLDKIVSLAGEVTTSDYTTVVMLDEEGKPVRSAEISPAVPDLPDLAQRARPAGHTNWIVRTRQAVVVDDVAEDGTIISQEPEGAPRTLNPYMMEAGVESFAGLPLITRGRLLGVLYLHSLRPRNFRGRLPLLTTFANQAAIAVENASLYANLEQKVAELAKANEELRKEIAERVRAEEALHESKRLLEKTFINLRDAIFIIDADTVEIIDCNPAASEVFGYSRQEMLGRTTTFLHVDEATLEEFRKHLYYAVEEKGFLFLPEFSMKRKDGQVFSTEHSVTPLEDEQGERIGWVSVVRDITERKQAEEELRQRNRELALLTRASQAFISTLELDQVLTNVLEGVRHLLDVVACSAWLVDPASGELVCQQTTGPRSEAVRGWRLAPGEGIVGWVARSGESLIVPDTQADGRHFKDVDQRTGLEMRSVLSVPLRVRQDVVGVLQVVDAQVNRFSLIDLMLMESLAATAAIAIENARLYEQARRDAETKAALLREVNHRVKNNLAAIVGLLYAERRRAGLENQAAYQSIMENLVNRVQGLATVHSMLAAAEWAPLLLSELATRVVHSSLRALPRDKSASVDVTPSPVRVTSDQAHNLALVINELATNTVKYTLQERNTANITIRIALDGDAVLCEFRDDGPGYPEEILRLERYGVGFDLLQNIVRKSLHGELSLYNDHGAVAVIRFKAKEA